MAHNLVHSIAPANMSSTDSAALAVALRVKLRGEVRFDSGSRALYATDGSNYRQVPIGVVLPYDNDDVLAAIAACREFGAPLLCRGGGTSLAGQCCNVAVVLDFTRHMGKILEIDPARRIARVQPGLVLDHLRNAAEKHHLTFAPDPASHDRCTIGGMIGNNSCGVHSIMGGKTDDNIEALMWSPTMGSASILAQAVYERTHSFAQAAQKIRAAATTAAFKSKLPSSKSPSNTAI